MSRSSRKKAAAGRRAFSAEFKAEAVALMRARRAQGVSLTQIARDLAVRPNLLWAWAREAGGPRAPDAPDARGESLAEEVRRLRREVAVLRQEREFAKKAAAFFAKESL